MVQLVSWLELRGCVCKIQVAGGFSFITIRVVSFFEDIWGRLIPVKHIIIRLTLAEGVVGINLGITGSSIAFLKYSYLDFFIELSDPD